MKFKLGHIVNRYFKHHAIVLMYHRVNTLKSDVWDLAVNPEHFEQQLKVLKASRKVVPLRELIESIKHNKLRHNNIAITFDDGYADNYLLAKPLLEKYQLPATFFITSGNLGKTSGFWWDELERLLLFTKELPSVFQAYVAGTFVNVNLHEEAQLSDELSQVHSAWKATQHAPPSYRSELFIKLWQLLKPLPAEELQEQLQHIRNWAGVKDNAGGTHICLTFSQLQEIGRHNLFDIGAHTSSHAALGNHSKEYQQREIEENKNLLEEITGNKITLLSYPYGNYNAETMTVAAELGFEAAFTTEERSVTNKAPFYQLGRFQVPNIAAPDFKHAISHWASNS